MAFSWKIPRHLRNALGPQAGDELVLILEEMRREAHAQSARIDARFDRIDQRFDQVNQRFDQVNQRLDRADGRFDMMDERFTSLDRRVSDVKSDLMKWSFVFWCGSVTAIALLARVLER